MGPKGKRKIAMLLMTLDPATASELLKGQPQEIVEEIAMELSRLDATGQAEPEQIMSVAKEFLQAIQGGGAGGLHVRSFVNNILKGSSGKARVAQLQKAMHQEDPFIAIAAASPTQIATALEGEPPQAVALVLSALPPKISTEVLDRLDEQVSLKAVWRMTKPGEVSSKTMHRIGEMVCKKLEELTSEEQSPFEEVLPRETLRKVAIVLSGLTKEKRDALLEEIDGNDKDTAKMVKALMVTWEDIPKIEDRSLQEALRKVDAGILAKALYGAEPVIIEKIRSNISERAAQMVDEETELMSEPRKKDILEAREEVVKPLREANEAEELMFIEED